MGWLGFDTCHQQYEMAIGLMGRIRDAKGHETCPLTFDNRPDDMKRNKGKLSLFLLLLKFCIIISKIIVDLFIISCCFRLNNSNR